MTDKQRKKLIKSQQGELDGVAIYRKLASAMKDKEKREILLSVAADEGKHAAILKGYTGVILKPKSAKAYFVWGLYKVCGMKLTMKIISQGESSAIAPYEKLAKDFPKIKEIIKDEAKHAKIALSLID